MTVVMTVGIDLAAKIVLMPRFQLLEALKLISREKPTMMPVVPTILTAMLNYEHIKSYDLSSLKFCLSGGAPLPLETKLKFEALAGATKVVEGYGLSETSPVLTANPLDGEPVSGSIGLPLPATIISLRDIDDPTKEVPQGERGELCAKGPQVMKGYWKRPAETERQFVGEFLRTGDVAIMDERGYFSIVDRIKDLIICSGFNVYPRRIEEAIYAHPAVEEVTVIGVPDSYRGEAPKAFVKLKSGMTATAADLLKFLEPKISRIEMPAAIEFRDSLPKTMIGKLSKKELVAEEAKRGKSA
jgi:long-chain acyl-CoA synthetase